MSHSILAPVHTHRAVITGSKKPFVYKGLNTNRVAAVSQATVKARLGIDSGDTNFDALIDLLTAGVTEFAERYTGLTFIDQNYVTFRDFFTDSFELRRAPISAITHVKYTDNDDAQQTVVNTVYGLTQTQYQRVFERDDQTWPGDKKPEPETIEIQFVAGFGAADTDIPGDIRMALLAHIVSVFTKAGDCCDEGLIPSTSLNTYKQRRILSLKIVQSEG